jgi:uncharacterized protein YggT (Ycf19 family)
MLLAGSVRSDIANYVGALFEVYIILILLFILANWILMLGARPPYMRYTDSVLGFLREVCDPYLRVFRKLIPPIGMFDVTPIIAILVLYFARTLIVNAISG